MLRAEVGGVKGKLSCEGQVQKFQCPVEDVSEGEYREGGGQAILGELASKFSQQ